MKVRTRLGRLLGLIHDTPAKAEEAASPAISVPTDNSLPLFDLGRLRDRPRDENEALIRSLCRPVRLEDAVLCRVLGRYKMYVDPHDIGLAPHLMLDGIWEMHITEAVLGFVRSGMTVVDAGANQGYYTMLFSELVGPEGRVLAAEPNPRMMSLLCRSAAVNGFQNRILPIELPLSARSGDRVNLQIPDGLPQNASMVWGDGAHPDMITLSTTTLDEQVGDGPIDFIKIDVEGAEEAVWSGMDRILARQKPLAIFLEFSPVRYPDPEAFLHRMMGRGFALAMVHGYGGVRAASIPEVLAGPEHQDRILALVR